MERERERERGRWWGLEGRGRLVQGEVLVGHDQGGEVGAASDVVVPKENLRADALTGRGERGAGKGWGREATTGTCGIDVTPGGTSCRTSSSRSGWCVTEISVYSHPSISKSRFAAW